MSDFGEVWLMDKAEFDSGLFDPVVGLAVLLSQDAKTKSGSISKRYVFFMCWSSKNILSKKSRRRNLNLRYCSIVLGIMERCIEKWKVIGRFVLIFLI